MNIFIGIGNLTKAVEIRYTTKDLEVANFTLAIKRPTKENETDFINCVAYGKTAEIMNKYLDKGSQVAIEGHIQTGSYEKDGKKVYTTDVIVDKIAFVGSKKETDKNKPYEEMGNKIQQETEIPF